MFVATARASSVFPVPVRRLVYASTSTAADRTWRAVEQAALGRLDAHAHKELGVAQRQLNDLRTHLSMVHCEAASPMRIQWWCHW